MIAVSHAVIRNTTERSHALFIPFPPTVALYETITPRILTLIQFTE